MEYHLDAFILQFNPYNYIFCMYFDIFSQFNTYFIFFYVSFID